MSDLKEKIRRKKANSFSKPGNDPGIKNRPVPGDSNYDPSANYDEEVAESSGGGRGCCGSITGFMGLIAVLAAVVIVVFLVKCL